MKPLFVRIGEVKRRGVRSRERVERGMLIREIETSEAWKEAPHNGGLRLRRMSLASLRQALYRVRHFELLNRRWERERGQQWAK